jgi:diguanylate cyclase (GGDEF)-like protein/PAS domain S-box-containing protein
MQLLPVGVAVVDGHGICQSVNVAFCRAIGREEATTLGVAWWSFVHSEDQDRIQSSWLIQSPTGEYSSFESSVTRADGSLVWIYAQISEMPVQKAGDTLYMVTWTDVSFSKLHEREIQQLAFYDALTGLPNRRLLMDRLKQALALSARSKLGGALLFLDLDNFKTLNDTMGHHMGDRLLQQVASRLKACVREGDTVARLGGDEFVAVLENLSVRQDHAARQAKQVAEKILLALNEPYTLGQVEHSSTPSVGITLFQRPSDSVDELMKRADMAMYQSKAAGRNTLRFFDPEMQAVVTARIELENELRLALQEKQFVLHYQPQVDASGVIKGAEAFVRWQHPSRGMVSPAAFIPLAEDSGLILPLGAWVLEAACKQLAVWAESPATAHLTMEVKVSAVQLRQPNFVESVLQVMEKTGVRPDLLKMELNESLLVVDVEDVIAKTNALSAHGVVFSLADLGTGYSSLSHLKRLALDQLRIDQSFVRGLLTNSNDAAVTRSIFALADSLDLPVGAEGVETKEQRDVLAAHGCLEFQGYLFSQPLSACEFSAMVAERR